MLARVEQERLESLKYERASIYVKCVDDSEDGKTEDDTEVSQTFQLLSIKQGNS